MTLMGVRHLGCPGDGTFVALDAAGIATAKGLERTPAAITGWLGRAATVAAQLNMGSSWRVCGDPRGRTQLVTGGAFALARFLLGLRLRS